MKWLIEKIREVFPLELGGMAYSGESNLKEGSKSITAAFFASGVAIGIYEFCGKVAPDMYMRFVEPVYQKSVELAGEVSELFLKLEGMF